MTDIAKAKQLAIRWTEGDKSFDGLVEAFRTAIEYGRTQERKAALRRLESAYQKTNAFDHGDFASFEVMNTVRAAIEGPPK